MSIAKPSSGAQSPTLQTLRPRKQVTAETKKWLFNGDNLQGKILHKFRGLKAGTLTAMCYPDADYPQLRVCNDFLTYLFHLDNLLDDQSTTTTVDIVLNSLYYPHSYRSPARVGKMTRNYYKRMVLTASPGAQQQFIQTFDFFLPVSHAQARAAGVIPDLEFYIALRRDTSGCKPSFVLIEYANNLDIPDEVMEHPLIASLGKAANDLVTWSNIFCRGLFGEMCKQSIDRFNEDRTQLPSWGPKIDRDIDICVDGLANWIVGSLHWAFMTERYFGKKGTTVKASRVVDLLPLRK
ncbi:isoprenoid synthase domain-containing protein [Mycena sanguinolenta]|nr:isoprenoid synthase domain-containing protein [Mycena sanguinolenta]